MKWIWLPPIEFCLSDADREDYKRRLKDPKTVVSTCQLPAADFDHMTTWGSCNWHKDENWSQVAFSNAVVTSKGH